MLLLTITPPAERRALSEELDELLGTLRETGGGEALAALYDKTRKSVFGFALSLLGDPHEAEDVMQDCYLRVCGAVGSYRSAGKPMAWVLRIVRNLCTDTLRRRGRIAEIAPEAWEAYLHSREALSPEDRLVLASCLADLVPQERQIVVLHAVAGLKHREIATLLEAPLPTVLSRYRRAIAKLRAALEKGEEL